MPFKNLLSDIKSQVKDLQKQGQQFLSDRQGQQHQQQYPGQQHPPPVPQNTHPTSGYMGQNQSQPQGQQPLPGAGNIYWSPRFDPAIPLSQEWEFKTGNNNGWGNHEMQHYTDRPENAFYTQNNTLILRAISQPRNSDPTQKYTSARLVSHQRLSRPSGSLTATLSLPCAGGIWPAFWLLPYEPFSWPTDGEIDIAETWNGDGINHSCLHWGYYNAADTFKHRVVGTPIQGMQSGRPVKFEFAWNQNPQTREGRMIWWIDGAPVMKAPIPQDMGRPLADFVVLLNVAMGGDVCQGRVPNEGAYEMIVHWMGMMEGPEGGWERFERDWNVVREGDKI